MLRLDIVLAKWRTVLFRENLEEEDEEDRAEEQGRTDEKGEVKHDEEVEEDAASESGHC